MEFNNQGLKMHGMETDLGTFKSHGDPIKIELTIVSPSSPTLDFKISARRNGILF